MELEHGRGGMEDGGKEEGERERETKETGDEGDKGDRRQRERETKEERRPEEWKMEERKKG